MPMFTGLSVCIFNVDWALGAGNSGKQINTCLTCANYTAAIPIHHHTVVFMVGEYTSSTSESLGEKILN